MDWVNLSEYGRMRGCSSEAVKQAIQKGRLKQSVRQKENGKWEVNPIAANIEWQLSTRHKHRPKKLDAEFLASRMGPTITIPPDNLPPTAEGQVSLIEAQRRHEAARAEIAEIKAAQLRAELVEVEKVKADAFKLARGVRDGLLNIPDRVAAEFAGINVAAEIHMRLTDELRKALEVLIVEHEGGNGAI